MGVVLIVGVVCVQVPSSGVQFEVTLSSPTWSEPELGFSLSSATISASPRTVSVFHVVNSSLARVVSAPTDRIQLSVQRTAGTQTQASISVTTMPFTSSVAVGGLTFQPATPIVHFAPISQLVTFSAGQSEQQIQVEAVIAVATSPLAFRVIVESSSR